MIYFPRSATDVCDKQGNRPEPARFIKQTRILSGDLNSLFFLLFSLSNPFILSELEHYEMERRQDPEGRPPGRSPRRLRLRHPAQKPESSEGGPQRHPRLIGQADEGDDGGEAAETDAARDNSGLKGGHQKGKASFSLGRHRGD